MNAYPNYLSSNQIINLSLFESIRESVICLICLGVLVDPTSCSKCENTFCKSCMQTWKLSQTAHYLCPMKCIGNKFQEPSSILKSILSKLEFKCNYCLTDVKYTYHTILQHLSNECNQQMIDCLLCNNPLRLSDYKSSKFYLEYCRQAEVIKQLSEQNRKLKQENLELNKKVRVATEESSCKLKLLMNQHPESQTVGDQFNMFDKCRHYKGNYIPIFKCCDKSYPCYLCHKESTSHLMELSDRVICLCCQEIYSGNRCDCGAFQLYKKKEQFELV